MAIVSMKKMRLLALKRDKGRILRQLQKMGCVELIQEDQAPEQKALPAEDARRCSRCRRCLGRKWPGWTGLWTN